MTDDRYLVAVEELPWPQLCQWMVRHTWLTGVGLFLEKIALTGVVDKKKKLVLASCEGVSRWIPQELANVVVRIRRCS